MNTQAQQEPAVTVLLIKRNTDTLIVILCHNEILLFSGIGFQIINNLFAIGTEILFGNANADFLTLCRLFQVSNQTVKGLAFHAELCRFDDNFGNQISAVIEEIILLHSGMTGGFNRQRTGNAVFILTDRLVNDILIASLKAQVLAAQLLFDEFFQAGRGNGIGNDHRTLLIFQSDSGGQCDQTITVDFLALCIHSAAAVNVRIENDTEIRTEGLDSRTDGFHRLSILRIRDMIREHTVRL